MLIERNLISPLRSQIEKIVNTNAENGKLVASIDKDRPNNKNNDSYEADQETGSKNEHSLETSEDLAEQTRKLDLIA